MLSFLKLRWKSVLVLSAFIFLGAAAWAYREEIQSRAKAMAELSRAQQMVEQSEQAVEQLKEERKAAEQVLRELRRQSEENDRQYRANIRELTNANAETWRHNALPRGLNERLRQHYGAGPSDSEGSGEATEGTDDAGSETRIREGTNEQLGRWAFQNRQALNRCQQKLRAIQRFYDEQEASND